VGDVDRQLRDLFANATALMFVKDVTGRYTLANQDYTRRFGISPEQVVGRTDEDLYPLASAAAYIANDAEVLATGQPRQTEEPYGEPSGHEDPTRRWVSLKFPLLDDAGVPYAVGGISTDITDLKRAEDLVRAARAEAERANRRKDELLSRMSHELRTPLNAILGFTQLLEREALTDAARQHVREIGDAGRHLLALVNDALDIAWLESGAPGMQLIAIPAAEALQQALTIMRPLARDAGVEIASDLHAAIGHWVHADAQRLRQVFLNLVGNAVKFNRADGFVRVSCRDLEDRIRYRVTDTGPGIAPEDIPQLFTPFSRLAGAETVEGSGLGLAFSRRLARAMGGEVDVEHSAPGEGSTFFVEVPKVLEPREAGHDAVRHSDLADLPQLGPVTIVQIEDTEANQRLVERVVGAMGQARLWSARTARAGLELVAETVPDLILLDLNLPDLPATEVLQRLRNSPHSAGCPVMVLSADATPSRIEHLRSLGVARYITKPFDVHDLATAISEVVS
jgi:PAS domain S-box-containing protein